MHEWRESPPARSTWTAGDLASGEYTLQVQAVDAAGKVLRTVSRTFAIVDPLDNEHFFPFVSEAFPEGGKLTVNEADLRRMIDDVAGHGFNTIMLGHVHDELPLTNAAHIRKAGERLRAVARPAAGHPRQHRAVLLALRAAGGLHPRHRGLRPVAARAGAAAAGGGQAGAAAVHDGDPRRAAARAEDDLPLPAVPGGFPAAIRLRDAGLDGDLRARPGSRAHRPAAVRQRLLGGHLPPLLRIQAGKRRHLRRAPHLLPAHLRQLHLALLLAGRVQLDAVLRPLRLGRLPVYLPGVAGAHGAALPQHALPHRRAPLARALPQQADGPLAGPVRPQRAALEPAGARQQRAALYRHRAGRAIRAHLLQHHLRPQQRPAQGAVGRPGRRAEQDRPLLQRAHAGAQAAREAGDGLPGHRLGTPPPYGCHGPARRHPGQRLPAEVRRRALRRLVPLRRAAVQRLRAAAARLRGGGPAARADGGDARGA